MVGEHFNRKDAVYVFGPREPIVARSGKHPLDARRRGIRLRRRATLGHFADRVIPVTMLPILIIPDSAPEP
jgi:hypothetical protein